MAERPRSTSRGAASPPDPPSGAPPDPEPESYAAAEAELEQILAALEADAVDVDELARHVARATSLIRWCRQRVDAAELAITELLADDQG